MVKDSEKVRACVRSLISELVKDREVEIMNVALPGEALPEMSERRISVPLQKRVVESGICSCRPALP
ncbi:MAG: hypothetical protein V8S95_09320 [Odoribacter sp.]